MGFASLAQPREYSLLANQHHAAAEAKLYYEKIIARFDKPDALPIVQSVVRGCKARLDSTRYGVPASAGVTSS